MSELRFNPFAGTWTVTATHRQDRTFLPPADFCPLCPTRSGGAPTEVPTESYDIAVFENKFPSLSDPPPPPAVQGTASMPVAPSLGVCEVVCYTDRHDTTFADLSLKQVRKLAHVWRDRYRELSKLPGIRYVYIFENEGAEVGVTLSHPHGQIYAMPFLPRTVEAEVRRADEFAARTGRNLTGAWLDEELADGRRVVLATEDWVATVPFFAEWPYETWIVPRRHIRSLAEADDAALDTFAEVLLAVARKFDRLFGFSMPYIMSLHQEPSNPGWGHAWLRAEFRPPYRTAEKLKYMAGIEVGAGLFANDTLPEDTAARLREL